MCTKYPFAHIKNPLHHSLLLEMSLPEKNPACTWSQWWTSVCAEINNFWEAVLHLLHKSDAEAHVWNFLAQLCMHLDSVGKSSTKLIE